MARTIQSPGVEIKEVDLSLRPALPVGTNIFISGFAQKRPTDEVLEIASLSEFEQIYGLPTNAAERYFYHTVRAAKSSPGNVLVTRLPYGAAAGDNVATGYSALVYPVYVQPERTTGTVTGGISLSASTGGYWFGEPSNVQLTEEQYQLLTQGHLDWQDDPTVSNFLTGTSTSDAQTWGKAGMIIVNTRKNVINEKFEGFYVGISDNTNLNPATNFDSILNLKSLNPANTIGTNYVTVPLSRLAFTLHSPITAGGIQYTRDNTVSEIMENLSQYDISTPEFSDTIAVGVFKIRRSVLEPDTTKLDYILVESYVGSLNSYREHFTPDGGPAQSMFIEDIASSSTNIRCFVNPYISKHSGNWFDQENAIPEKRVRVKQAAVTTVGAVAASYDWWTQTGTWVQSTGTVEVTDHALLIASDVTLKLTPLADSLTNATGTVTDFTGSVAGGTAGSYSYGGNTDDDATNMSAHIALDTTNWTSSSTGPTVTINQIKYGTGGDTAIQVFQSGAAVAPSTVGLTVNGYAAPTTAQSKLSGGESKVRGPAITFSAATPGLLGNGITLAGANGGVDGVAATIVSVVESTTNALGTGDIVSNGTATAEVSAFPANGLAGALTLAGGSDASCSDKSIKYVDTTEQAETSAMICSLDAKAHGENIYPSGTFQKTDITTRVVGSIPTKLERVFELVDNWELYPIDIVPEAGLGTIYAGTKGGTAPGFDDEVSVNIDALSATQVLNTPPDVVSNYRYVNDAFVDFAQNKRKDLLYVADGLRYIYVQGRNSKTLEQTDPANPTSKKNFSQHIYWPNRHVFGNVNTSFACTYANWARVFDGVLNRGVWAPFSGFAAAAMANTDSNFYPWYAPAGFTRGLLSGVSDIALYPRQKHRDQLYKISLNPVANFPNDGFVIFGQKTFQKKPSAFDRINVRRLFLYLEKAVRATVKYFVFEPNTLFTRTQVVNVLTPIFENAKNTDGMYDYLLICDERNNTPDVIDQNELVVDIYIKPVRAAEFILVNFYATRTGQDFSEIVS